jgi:hypothetical protein
VLALGSLPGISLIRQEKLRNSALLQLYALHHKSELCAIYALGKIGNFGEFGIPGLFDLT